MGDPPIALPDGSLSWGDAWGSLVWVVVLLTINAFFVAVEFSLVSVRRSRITRLASEGNQQAELVKQAQDHLERSLSTTQLGITLASVTLGWISAQAVSSTVTKILSLLPFLTMLGSPGLNTIAIVITFTAIMYLQIVLGELLPKTLAIVYSEPISLRLAPLNHFVSWILKPFVEVPRFSSRLILRLARVDLPDAASLYSTMTAEELQLLIASSEEAVGIEKEERELLSNVFEFGETVASEVMIPRTSVDAVGEAATLQDVLTEVAESSHSRYPVYGESLDDIRGLINIKELVAAMAEGKLQLESPIQPWIRPAHFEHENKLIAELLPEMQQHHRAMVIIVDEFGGTAGLITIKDIVEEIVGNLSDGPDESDEEPDIQYLDDDSFSIQAQLNIEEINEKLSLDLPVHDDYQTLGGFLIYKMQKIPRVGEKLIYQTYEFQVTRIEGPRLDRIKVTPLRSESSVTESLEVTPETSTAGRSS